MRLVAGKVLEARQFQQAKRALARWRLRQAEDIGGQHDVLQHARPGKQDMFLEYDCNVPRWPIQHGAVAPNFALRRNVQPGDQPQQSGFSATGRAHHGDERARCDSQIERTERSDNFVPTAENFCHARELDGRRILRARVGPAVVRSRR